MKENKNKKSSKFVVLFLLFIILTLLVGIVFLLNDKSKSDYEDKIDVITKIDYAERQDALNQVVEEGMINICYSTNAVFDGTVSTSFNVQNSINNHGDMIFEIYDENDNIIYKSKKIKPGYELNNIELEKQLSKGIHECKIKIGYADKGNVSSVFPLTIVVE